MKVEKESVGKTGNLALDVPWEMFNAVN